MAPQISADPFVAIKSSSWDLNLNTYDVQIPASSNLNHETQTLSIQRASCSSDAAIASCVPSSSTKFRPGQNGHSKQPSSRAMTWTRQGNGHSHDGKHTHMVGIKRGGLHGLFKTLSPKTFNLCKTVLALAAKRLLCHCQKSSQRSLSIV